MLFSYVFYFLSRTLNSDHYSIIYRYILLVGICVLMLHIKITIVIMIADVVNMVKNTLLIIYVMTWIETTTAVYGTLTIFLFNFFFYLFCFFCEIITFLKLNYFETLPKMFFSFFFFFCKITTILEQNLSLMVVLFF